MNRTPFKSELIKAEHREMGLAIHGGKMFWRMPKYGWLRGWPEWLKNAIIMVWNTTACILLGHSHLCRRAPGELPVCCDCSRKVRPTPEQESSVINEW